MWVYLGIFQEASNSMSLWSVSQSPAYEQCYCIPQLETDCSILTVEEAASYTSTLLIIKKSYVVGQWREASALSDSCLLIFCLHCSLSTCTKWGKTLCSHVIRYEIINLYTNLIKGDEGIWLKPVICEYRCKSCLICKCVLDLEVFLKTCEMSQNHSIVWVGRVL